MYTVEIYKTDGRIKKTKSNPNGERLILKKDYDTTNLSTREKRQGSLATKGTL
jgi:hypothetical protein